MTKTNLLQHTRFSQKRVEVKVYLVKYHDEKMTSKLVTTRMHKFLSFSTLTS